MTVKTDLYELWTAKSMQQATTIESDEPRAFRAASRTVYRAYHDGLKALYTTDNLTELKRVLQRRLKNPFLAARHATYLSMLHDLAIVTDLAALAGGDGDDA